MDGWMDGLYVYVCDPATWTWPKVFEEEDESDLTTYQAGTRVPSPNLWVLGFRV